MNARKVFEMVRAVRMSMEHDSPNGCIYRLNIVVYRKSFTVWNLNSTPPNR